MQPAISLPIDHYLTVRRDEPYYETGTISMGDDFPIACSGNRSVPVARRPENPRRADWSMESVDEGFALFGQDGLG